MAKKYQVVGQWCVEFSVCIEAEDEDDACSIAMEMDPIDYMHSSHFEDVDAEEMD